MIQGLWHPSDHATVCGRSESWVFYEVQEGMTPDEAERLYQYVYGRISEVVCELPFNYAMADGLLYISRAKAGMKPASMAAR